MISPEKAGKLLDEVVYERVVSFVDLFGLAQFEQELEFALIEVGVEYDEVARVAKEMIDGALQRLSEDEGIRRLAANPPFDDCELCREQSTAGAR